MLIFLKSLRIERNSSDLLFKYCKTIKDWPESWVILRKDMTIAKAINKIFREFLIDQIEKRKSKRQIKKDAKYLQILGRELIASVHADRDWFKPEKKPCASDIISNYVDWLSDSIEEGKKHKYRFLYYFLLCQEVLNFLQCKRK